ncbi:hypothetical protein A2382_01375 [Candidatus Woesebacteria bacterium RIFOXYB1_FULL_38_16]|uniref:Glucose/Sorbosone dehydrogenase domain-containing protein n=1 Tax=Candidatus Woesebacteria bacterium RIFOXYB1_FULL_38_16 TaxID=1802538 RepID=A0A1F8CTH0_9BACT|nr:MAG: hypothetical protein A2382_01375 [Candidatus Woesebacteria bacterium RIFOXYB1_FULL_38_16]
MKKILAISFFLLVFSIIAFMINYSYLKDLLFYTPPTSQVPADQIYQGISYEPLDPEKYEVKLLSSKLVSPSRVKLTPDEKHLLVSQLSGEIFAYERINNDTWSSDPYLVTKIDTHFPGFPPNEAGLTGLVFSSEFEKNNNLFLLYTYKDRQGKTQNRISQTKLSLKNGKLKGTKPKLIYEANIEGAASHQITDGIGINYQGQPHLLFLIGEGFKAENAQNPSLEAGKVILIQENGLNPQDPRPYSENPKVEAIGIRNSYVITPNLDEPGNFLFADSGPDKYDRIISAKFALKSSPTPLNFLWRGNADDLAKPIPDPFNPKITDLVIYRFPEPRTVTGMKMLPNSKGLLVTLFGQTGSNQNTPGKEILLGKITDIEGQPSITFESIIKRTTAANDKLGNPIGLEIDSKTKNFFFADILEGRLYEVVTKKGGDR